MAAFDLYLRRVIAVPDIASSIELLAFLGLVQNQTDAAGKEITTPLHSTAHRTPRALPYPTEPNTALTLSFTVCLSVCLPD